MRGAFRGLPDHLVLTHWSLQRERATASGSGGAMGCPRPRPCALPGEGAGIQAGLLLAYPFSLHGIFTANGDSKVMPLGPQLAH